MLRRTRDRKPLNLFPFKRFKVFRDSLVQVYHPVVNQQAIAKLAWPPRPTLDVGR